jgi:hypothetical protein
MDATQPNDPQPRVSTMCIRRRQRCRRDGRCRMRSFDGSGVDRSDEPIAAFRQCLNQPRLIRGVAEGFADAINRLVQPSIEVDEGVRRPQALLKGFARDQLPGLVEQHRQDLKGLLRKMNLCSAASELARP